jgi:hypothetical protein
MEQVSSEDDTTAGESAIESEFKPETKLDDESNNINGPEKPYRSIGSMVLSALGF